MILPDAQDPCAFRAVSSEFRIDLMNLLKDRIGGISDTNKTILIFLRTILSLLVLLELVERNDASAKTQTYQLVPAADGKHGNGRAANKAGKALQNQLVIIVEVAERPAYHNSIGLKLRRRCC